MATAGGDGGGRTHWRQRRWWWCLLLLLMVSPAHSQDNQGAKPGGGQQASEKPGGGQPDDPKPPGDDQPGILPEDRTLGFPTETEGDPDTTHTTQDYTVRSAKDYTWPEVFLNAVQYRMRSSTPFWPPVSPEKWPAPAKHTFAPDKKMDKFPPFEPWVFQTTTQIPSRKYGRVLLAQGYYMLINMVGEWDCTRLIFIEIVLQFQQRKDCLPSYNKNWFWVFPWVPNLIHSLRVKDRSSKKVLLVQSYFSLPEEMPKPKDIAVTKGINWMQITFTQPYEKGPSLIGYVVFYRNTLDARMKDRWLDIVSGYIVYDEQFPYVRPTHPCKVFRQNKTFCILLSDHVGALSLADRRDKGIYIQFLVHRLGPGPWRPYLVKHWNEKTSPCLWHNDTYKCAEVMEPGGKRGPYPHRDMMRVDDTTTTQKPNADVKEGGPDALHIFPNTTRGPQMLRDLRQEDLCVIFLGLTLLLLVLGVPVVYFLGQRSGEMAVEDRWARLASQAGTVSVPLGHGGPYWRGRSTLPHPR